MIVNHGDVRVGHANADVRIGGGHMRGSLLFGAATAALMMFAPAPRVGAGRRSSRRRQHAAQLSPAARSKARSRRPATSTGTACASSKASATASRSTASPTPTAPPSIRCSRIYDAEGNQLAFNDDADGSLNSALHYTPHAKRRSVRRSARLQRRSDGPLSPGASTADADPAGRRRQRRQHARARRRGRSRHRRHRV